MGPTGPVFFFKKTECQNQTRLAVSAAVLLRLAVR